MNNEVVCHTQGQVGTDTMTVSVGRSICGDELDGVGIRLGNARGSFVVSWSDFERAYLACKEWRERHGPPFGSIAEAIAANSTARPQSSAEDRSNG